MDITVLDGETYGNGDPKTFGLPLDQYDWLRTHDPVHRMTFDNPMLIPEVRVVTRYADVEAVDRTPDLFSAEGGVVNIWTFSPLLPAQAEDNGLGKPALLVMDGEDHTRNRRVLARAFTPPRAKELELRFREHARKTLDAALSRDGAINFVDEVAHVMPMQALGDVLGVPEEDRQKFFGWVDSFAAPFDERIAPSFEQVITSILDLLGYAIELRDLRRKHPDGGVMSQIVAAGDSDAMSDDEIMGNVALMASGAAESTRSALSHAIHQLLLEPDKMAWFRAHADDIPMTAVQEIVRVSAPFVHFVRQAKVDTELSGVEIPQGTWVAPIFAAANFDPDVFDNPREFDPTREENPHYSFGRGPHSCLGRHVAAIEIKILLEELFQRTSAISRAGDIAYVNDTFARGVYELPVVLTPA